MNMESQFLHKPKEHATKQEFSREQIEFLQKKVGEMKDDALLEEDFEDLYDTNFILDAQKKVSEAKSFFEKNDRISNLKSEVEDNAALSKEYREIGEYLEALFYNKIGGEHGWIPNSLVWKTSEYDDYINGVDFIIETQNREFSLATDITFSHTKSLEKKLNRIQQRIRDGELPEITFYDSTHTEGQMLIPHVIFAVEKDQIAGTLRMWADGDDTVLDNHPIKAKILLEVEAQLEAFAMYAKKLEKRDISSAYNDMLSQIQKLIISEEQTIQKYKHKIENDRSYQLITNYCNTLKSQLENQI